MAANEIEIKIKMLRFLEIAYRVDEKLTMAIIKDKGPFSLNIDNKGNATLSGKAGNLKFSVNEEIKEYGIDFKYARILFSGNQNGVIRYSLSFGIGAEIMLSGLLDIENLLLNCSGLLCKAVRAYKFRARMIDKSISISMGK